MQPYRIFLSSIVSPCIDDLLGARETKRPAADRFAPIAVPRTIEAEAVPTKPLPNFYIDGLNVTDAFVLIIGSRFGVRNESAAAGDHGEPVLAFYKPAQFGEANVETFLRSLETKHEFEELLRSLGARYDRIRDGQLAPVRLAANLDGKTICLYRGGGIGDAIHYVRYARALKSRGARVIVMCGAREASLLANAYGVDSVLSGEEASVCDPVLPALPACDLGISFVAVPFACGPDGDDIGWSGPYIRIDARRAREARLILGHGSTLKVGLCWQSGGGGERAIPIRELLPILHAHAVGIEFINLQRGVHQSDVGAMREEGIRITDLEDTETSLVDTAAVISNLDLVISVDTMICHLAGALGRPVWTMLAHKPEWRWTLDSGDTPWYPSMRLFRQGPDRLWGPVVERMSRELVRLKSR
jgi:Glycosyltransferase family 9 (heptosyltransferase)